MEIVKLFKERILKKSFLIILLLTLLLYGFSYRFNLIFYAVPLLIYLFYFSFNKGLKIDIKALILFFFLIVYAVLLFIGGVIGLDFAVRLKATTYLTGFFLPMAYIFYNEAKTKGLEITYKNLLITYFILGYLIFFLYKNGFIASNRYQHVGNIMAGLVVLLFGVKHKKLKWILVIITFALLLYSGSRQAAVGLLFVGIVYLMLSNYKVIIYSFIASIIIYIKWDYLIEKIGEFANNQQIETLKRLVYAVKSNGGASVQVRFDIYERLIDKIKLLPNLSFSANKDSLLPHNFFLEYAVTCGYIISIAFIIFIFYTIIKTAYYNKNNVLVYFSLFYFVTFNVSSGITSAKYFLYYCFLLFVIQKLKTKNEIITS